MDFNQNLLNSKILTGWKDFGLNTNSFAFGFKVDFSTLEKINLSHLKNYLSLNKVIQLLLLPLVWFLYITLKHKTIIPIIIIF